MSIFTQGLKSLNEYELISHRISDGRLAQVVTGLSTVHKANLAAALSEDFSRPSVIITATEAEAHAFCDALNVMSGGAVVFPARDLVLKYNDSYSHEYERQRIAALSAIASRRANKLVASVDAVMLHTVPKSEFLKRSFEIRPGDEVPVNEIVQKFEAAGYIRCDQVEGMGQYALRGGILDVFSLGTKEPVRVEFWGDEIDTVSNFDIITQRRKESIDSLIITPGREFAVTDKQAFAEKLELHLKNRISKEHKQTVLDDIEKLRNGIDIKNTDRYMSLMYDEIGSVFDYFDEPFVFLSEYTAIKESISAFEFRMGEEIKDLLKEGILTKQLCNFYIDNAELDRIAEENNAIFLDTFLRNTYPIKVYEPIGITARREPKWDGSVNRLIEDIGDNLNLGFSGIVSVGSDKSAKTLLGDLTDKKISASVGTSASKLVPGHVVIVKSELTEGFSYHDAKFFLIAHSKGSIGSTVKRKAVTDKNHQAISSFEQLKRGDYIVHVTHGIGVFDGIQKITADGITKDYIRLKYAGQDVLYVPVTQLDLVTKYIGPREDGNIKLNKLGSSEWKKSKQRVKAAVKDMAKQLKELYAKRASIQGFAFSKDSEYQRDFEAHFEYEETFDQNRCIAEIKRDMESTVPMDRLLCGDVGFGKTEVALRAAFKCVVDGKQCAILVPTTILAYQHYNTLMRRMEGFPVTVKQLSRFVPKSQQEKTIKDLKKGIVDIVVGTHRMISKDVRFKDIGLLIIDEEQRFGVAQKERLKELFPKVDVLTLSATPIPRTLNMALSGIRDMSVIEEAPGDRYPVQTYVTEYDFSIIRDAIEKEVRRGGQVYYVYNNIEYIYRVASRIAEELPDVRVAVAHGKMSEEEISKAWRDLLENNIDVLVSTTIIETGVDVPNVNTLIVENADRMGLSQLHQLRGRIGRSSRRAYAYFTFKPDKSLSDIASQRLSAIREFTEFGSGFKIAVRDLEIRGAGNLLGSQQHGNMESVGYELYIKMLDQAVKEERGEAVGDIDKECLIDLQINAGLPESYIPNLQQRLTMYRKIAEIKTDADESDLIDELIDRYGEPPKDVSGLIKIARLRALAIELGINEISQKPGMLMLYPENFDMKLTERFIKSYGKGVMIGAGNKPYIAVKTQNRQDIIKVLHNALNHLQNAANDV